MRVSTPNTYVLSLIVLFIPFTGWSQPGPLSDLYSSIKAQEANFPLPQTDATITVGTLDLSFNHAPGKPKKDINFNYAIPTYQDGSFYYIYVPIPPDERDEAHPNVTARRVTVHNIGGALSIANILHLNIRFAITNWNMIPSGNVIIQLGSQTQTIPKGQTEVIFTNVTEINPTLAITINGYLFASGQPEPYSLRGLIPLKIDWQTVGAGAITLPVLPVSIVYAPVVDQQKKNQSTSSISSNSGTSTTVSFSTEQGRTVPVPSAFSGVMDIQKDMSALGGILSKIPNPITQGVGAALNIISSGLGSSTATQTNSTTVTDQRTLAVLSSSMANQTALSSQGGPGDGDLISYYYNARVVWYSKNGTMRLAILGFDGFVQPTAAQLKAALAKLQQQPAGAIDPQLHITAAGINSLFQLDPFIAGGPGTTLAPPRFIDVSQGTVDMGGGTLTRAYTYTVTSTASNSTINTTTNVETDSKGFLSFLGLGVTQDQTLQTQISQSNLNQTASSQSYTQSFTFNGSGTETYSCWVYYDVVFGTFAYRDMSATGRTVQIAGTSLDNKGDVNKHELVTLQVRDKTFVTTTDATGQFKFYLPGIHTGHVKLSTQAAAAQLEYTGTPVTGIKLNAQ